MRKNTPRLELSRTLIGKQTKTINYYSVTSPTHAHLPEWPIFINDPVLAGN